MMNRKEEYIDELIQNIQDLETRVISVKTEDALSFSFFRDAFQKVKNVMTLLQELEMQQKADMKMQMEKLVAFLSETETQNKNKSHEEISDKPSIELEPEREQSEDEHKQSDDKMSTDEATPIQTHSVETSRNTYAEGIVLPVYTNPGKEREDEIKVEAKIEELPPAHNATVDRINNSPSLNDVLHAPPSKIEVKRNLSLNDRFFYQRELFDNKREKMNEVMDNINKLGTFEEVEGYLRNTTSWDFEDENVKGFLELLGKTQE